VAAGYDDPVAAVLIATGDAFADALAAGAASAAAGAPLLLVSGQAGVPAATRAQIERLQPQTIVVVGGDAAVAAHVGRQLAAIPTSDYVTRT
jgi:putative cell wall-binding protein